MVWLTLLKYFGGVPSWSSRILHPKNESWSLFPLTWGFKTRNRCYTCTLPSTNMASKQKEGVGKMWRNEFSISRSWSSESVRQFPVKTIKQKKAQQRHPIDFDDFGDFDDQYLVSYWFWWCWSFQLSDLIHRGKWPHHLKPLRTSRPFFTSRTLSHFLLPKTNRLVWYINPPIQKSHNMCKGQESLIRGMVMKNPWLGIRKI